MVSPTFCRTIDKLVETSLSLVLPSVLLLIHHSRIVIVILIHHCAVIPTFCSAIDTLVATSAQLVDQKFLIFKTFHVLYHHMEPRIWCLLQGPEIYLIFFLSNDMTAGEGGEHFINSSLPLPPASQYLDISRAITTESSPLHIGSSWT